MAQWRLLNAAGAKAADPADLLLVLLGTDSTVFGMVARKTHSKQSKPWDSNLPFSLISRSDFDFLSQSPEPTLGLDDGKTEPDTSCAAFLRWSWLGLLAEKSASVSFIPRLTGRPVPNAGRYLLIGGGPPPYYSIEG